MRAKLCLLPAGILAALSLYGLGCSTDSGGGNAPATAGNGAVNPGAGNGSTQPGGGNGSTQGGAGSVQGGTNNNPQGGAQVGTSGTTSTAGAPPSGGGSGPAGPSVGAAQFGDGDLDAVSDGGTLTFQSLGKAGFYPSRRDPASGTCEVYSNGTCCMTKHQLTDDKLTPWNEELIVTLRGPIQL